MTYRRLAIPIIALVASIVASSAAVVPAAGSSGAAGSTRQVAKSGTTTFRPSPSAADTSPLQRELGPGSGEADGAGSGNSNEVNRSRSIAHGAPSVTVVPVTAGQGVSSTGPLTVLNSFRGLNHRQQRLANGGNQFTLEPPDQGLCAGNGVVMEIINDVMTVYSPSGTALTGVEDLNTFFGYAAQFNRTTGDVGPFVTDPSCFFDQDTSRWFAVVLTLDVFTASGDFTGANHVDLAVSNSPSPTGSWTIYRVQAQDDGHNGTPNHGCTGIAPYGQATVPTYPNACIGDYPHLGVDANGVYVTTNEYSLFGNDFHGAQIYAFSKSALAGGASTVNVTQFD
ncbi:MAG TPA: hypothetical protein VEM94_02305, partial [Candidatus Dormibacteraeota bacterium]|nr:hypothetical protein [Candidatus Dormibacteraeota bacterium]